MKQVKQKGEIILKYVTSMTPYHSGQNREDLLLKMKEMSKKSYNHYQGSHLMLDSQIYDVNIESNSLKKKVSFKEGVTVNNANKNNQDKIHQVISINRKLFEKSDSAPKLQESKLIQNQLINLRNTMLLNFKLNPEKPNSSSEFSHKFINTIHPNQSDQNLISYLPMTESRYQMSTSLPYPSHTHSKHSASAPKYINFPKNTSKKNQTSFTQPIQNKLIFNESTYRHQDQISIKQEEKSRQNNQFSIEKERKKINPELQTVQLRNARNHKKTTELTSNSTSQMRSQSQRQLLKFKNYGNSKQMINKKVQKQMFDLDIEIFKRRLQKITDRSLK